MILSVHYIGFFMFLLYHILFLPSIPITIKNHITPIMTAVTAAEKKRRAAAPNHAFGTVDTNLR